MAGPEQNCGRQNRPNPNDPEALKEALTFLSERLGLPTPAANAMELVSQLPPLSTEQEAAIHLPSEEVERVLREAWEAERSNTKGPA